MKITWLGQAGLMLEACGKIILVDPYLSDSCAKLSKDTARRVPVEEKYLKIKPDIIVLTHDHADHTDAETLMHYLADENRVLVLASHNAWQRVRTIGSGNNCVSFNRHTVWTEGGLTFTAVKAEHSDEFAIGVVINDGDKSYYITGDTLYNKEIFSDLPEETEAVFLPVNGVGNNMNMADARRFAEKCGAKKAVPLHFGLFDSIEPEGFDIVPEIFKEIKL
ncbi:MAG: MBL fold metallo-hydrolase [Clostridia bacterium]|nr:MBL fold metallo-hydrolase [Clostridia bacterium]